MRIGVTPGLMAGRDHYWHVLSRALDVEFVPADSAGADAPLITDVMPERGNTPTFVIASTDSDMLGSVRFADDADLPSPLRNAVLEDATVPAPLDGSRGSVLARNGAGAPLWRRVGQVDEVAGGLSDFTAGDTIFIRLLHFTEFALIPLIAWTRRVNEDRWTLPPLRAGFQFDDPNLHRPSYGFIDFQRLDTHARELGYHASIAAVPIDMWYHHRRARTIFSSSRHLSMCIHGYRHTHHELGRLTEDTAFDTLQRAQTILEARATQLGFRFENVIVPPHAVISTPALEAAGRLGVEAVCTTWPEPESAVGSDPLVSWHPAHFVDGQAPVLPRRPLPRTNEGRIRIAAFVGHPILLYGHHEDVADGLDILGMWVDRLQKIGDVSWMSPAEMAQSSVSTRVTGDRLQVRIHAGSVRFEVGPEIGKVEIIHPNGGAPLLVESAEPGWFEYAVPGPVPAPRAKRVTPRPTIRRVLSESRDRLRPFTQRVRT